MTTMDPKINALCFNKTGSTPERSQYSLVPQTGTTKQLKSNFITPPTTSLMATRQPAECASCGTTNSLVRNNVCSYFDLISKDVA